MKQKTIITIGICILSLISLAIAGDVSNINLNFNQDDKTTLEKIGIGEISKIRSIYNNKTDEYYNETYIDKLQLININANTFLLYENEGINKRFQIERKQICAKQGMCIDEEMQEEYECCKEWRDETEQEVMIKAQAKAEEILNKIIKVTKDREQRNNVKLYEDKEIIIGG